MTDNTELKRLAEAANAVTSDARVEMTIASEPGPNQAEIDAVTAFMGAATPAAVLALIAENEELGRYLCTCRDCGGEGALHTGDWHSCGHMEPPEPVMEKCGECDGTGLLGEIQDLYQVITERDQLKAELATERQRRWDGNESAALERDEDVRKLRAEIAGLKTGYEAYERVNAELKAEVEALRREREGKVLCDLELFETLRDSANTEADEHRQCMATYRPLRQANLDSVVKKCDDLLAALGQGEQS